MNRKLIALLLTALLLFALTGCVANPSAAEDTADRPTVVVLDGETELKITEEAETVNAETGETTDTRVLNTVENSELTLGGKHSSGIKSICYRFDGGETTVVQGETVTVALPAGAELLELYVIGGNGIASQWAQYYFAP